MLRHRDHALRRSHVPQRGGALCVWAVHSHSVCVEWLLILFKSVGGALHAAGPSPPCFFLALHSKVILRVTFCVHAPIPLNTRTLSCLALTLSLSPIQLFPLAYSALPSRLFSSSLSTIQHFPLHYSALPSPLERERESVAPRFACKRRIIFMIRLLNHEDDSSL